MLTIEIVTEGFTLYCTELDADAAGITSAITLGDHYKPVVLKRITELKADYTGRVMIHVNGNEHPSVIYRFVAGEIDGMMTAKAW